ncbi:NF038130 family PEP-CTERM protein [Anabaena sp. PCC 7108]|uniref:NF038130 family PEP-CTERM protein n=1 Tax=Anabaena sp. PCC 7108 TaxID=163908 RepID=UPI00034C11E0|nr:NF038130 family PEP-CTERM protein [Anabaena sp. PCC 7108]
MKNTFGKLLVSASMAIGFGAVAANPAQAVSFSYNNPSQIKTYTGGSDGVFIANDTNKATKALTDGDVTSNVELWYSDENPTANVGFTATQGAYSATVSSVTATDWNTFGSQWLNDLLSTYTPFQSVWNSFSANTKTLVTGYFPTLGMGDPNIGNFAFGQNGGVELKLVGHLDVKEKLKTTVSSQMNTAWNAGVKTLFPTGTTLSSLTITAIDAKITSLQTQVNLATGATKAALQLQLDGLKTFKDVFNLQTTLNGYEGPLQASEIAKVVTGGQTHYAYSFNPTASGITASDDGVSYNAIYTWNTPGYKATPEPSAIFGILGVAGIFVAKRKFKKVSA